MRRLIPYYFDNKLESPIYSAGSYQVIVFLETLSSYNMEVNTYSAA